MVSLRTRYDFQYVGIEIDRKQKMKSIIHNQRNCTQLNGRNHHSKEKIKKHEHEENNNYCSDTYFFREVNSKYYSDNCEYKRD